MPRFQTSMILAQRSWPGAGDVDDCWVLADLAMVHAVAPWLNLPTVPVYREAAGNPDVQGEADGGQLRHSIDALRSLYPDYTWRRIIGGGWAELTGAWLEGRPTSVSLLSSELPSRLRFGFAGFHRVTLVRKADGRLLFANPLAAPYARWLEVEPSDVRTAILAYGRAKSGKPCVYAVTGPTLGEALDTYHPPTIVHEPADPAELAAAYNEGLAAAQAAVEALPDR